ncbi:beta-propeller fold lactonase family protein [Thalassomonas sp. M1454]|uniref:beta-propeller fold lactonase family protein n=1 Tax=Thalassomonas sp. M1454 TaxID=2594477 RepID=UPI0021B12502|nr:beta-propeller fold lactonase family protein [Thalassomonas sp. M1454]
MDIKEVAPETGKLSDYHKVELAGLSTFTFSRDKKYLYAQALIDGDRKQPSIATYLVTDDGKLNFLYNAPINAKATELKTDLNDQYIVGASYRHGVVSIWKLEKGIFKGELAKEITLEKKIPCSAF